MRTIRDLSWLLALAAPLAAQPRVAPPPRLTPAQQFQLGEKLRAWLAPRLMLEDARQHQLGATQAALRQGAERARTAFDQALREAARRARVPDVLRNLADTRAIFARAFAFAPATGGSFTTQTVEVGSETLALPVWLPGGYDPGSAYPLLVSLPFRAPGGRDWLEAREHLSGLWGGDPLLQHAVLAAPPLARDLVLDRPLADDPEEAEREARRQARVQASLDAVLRTTHLDTNRVVLECSQDTCLAALRAVSAAPQRFAGVVVRDPPDLSSIVPDNLRQVPLLFVVGNATEANAAAFAARLEAVGIAGPVQLVAHGSFPFPESNERIGAWLLQLRRDPFPRQVTLVPLTDRHRSAHWVTLEQADPVPADGASVRPRLDATVDAEHNAFRVQTRGIARFRLLVSDALLDLDREITVVLDGELVWRGRSERRLDDLADGVLRTHDPEWLFVREIKGLQVPERFRSALVEAATPRRAPGRADDAPGSPPSDAPDGSDPRRTSPGGPPVARAPAGRDEPEIEARNPELPRRAGTIEVEPAAPAPAASEESRVETSEVDLDLASLLLLAAPVALALFLLALLLMFRARPAAPRRLA